MLIGKYVNYLVFVEIKLSFIQITSIINLVSTIMQGTIKKLTDKNFGFISQEGSAKDIFFHASELDGVDFSELREGDTVSFEVNDTPKGAAAVKVRKA